MRKRSDAPPDFPDSHYSDGTTFTFISLRSFWFDVLFLSVVGQIISLKNVLGDC